MATNRLIWSQKFCSIWSLLSLIGDSFEVRSEFPPHLRQALRRPCQRFNILRLITGSKVSSAPTILRPPGFESKHAIYAIFHLYY